MPERPVCEVCGMDFKSASSLSAHRRRIHNVYKRKPRATRRISEKVPVPSAPALGASVKVTELALDPDENIIVVLSDGDTRWRAVIFEDGK